MKSIFSFADRDGSILEEELFNISVLKLVSYCVCEMVLVYILKLIGNLFHCMSCYNKYIRKFRKDSEKM